MPIFGDWSRLLAPSSTSVRTAVILAAGMGTRLKEKGVTRPKGFLQLGKRPIVEESILKLHAAGIDRLVIVTGHCANFYERLSGRFPAIVTVHNERYADSGSMYSLFCARELIDEDFLMLESDLIYERRALDFLLKHDTSDAILVSGRTYSGDEVYVETRDGCLVNMSKEPESLGEEIAGELVGITKISTPLFELMLKLAEQEFRSTLKVDYETDCLVAAAQHSPIRCPLVEDLLWAEIDDESHLERARRKIYPAICARDGTASDA